MFYKIDENNYKKIRNLKELKSLTENLDIAYEIMVIVKWDKADRIERAPTFCMHYVMLESGREPDNWNLLIGNGIID